MTREPWFAAPWWTSRWGWRCCGFFSFALGCEAIWGAVKFGGGWAWAYGVLSVVGLTLGAAFLLTANSYSRSGDA